MPVKRKITEPDGVYFITITCHQWLPLIEQTNGYDLVYNWFDHLKGKGHYVNGATAEAATPVVVSLFCNKKLNKNKKS